MLINLVYCEKVPVGTENKKKKISIAFVVETKYVLLCVKIFHHLTEKHKQMSHSLRRGISLTFSPSYSLILIRPSFGVVATPFFPGLIEGRNRA